MRVACALRLMRMQIYVCVRINAHKLQQKTVWPLIKAAIYLRISRCTFIITNTRNTQPRASARAHARCVFVCVWWECCMFLNVFVCV